MPSPRTRDQAAPGPCANAREESSRSFTPDHPSARRPSLQLELRPVAVSEHDRQWELFRRMLRAAVDDVGLKTVSFDLDVAPSVLLDGFDGRDRHHFRAQWVPYLVARARSAEIVEFLAALRDLEVRRTRPASPEEVLEATRAALGEVLGPEVLALVESKTRASLAERE